MSDVYISLYGDDGDDFLELREQLDDALPGGVESNADVVRAAMDYAEDALESE
jgi:hypothetical protein